LGKLPTVDLLSVGDLLNNQRLTWFLIGNLIGLGGLLLVVFASDAAHRSSPEPLARHSSSSQYQPHSALVIKVPKTMQAQVENPAANSAKIKMPSPTSALKKAASEGDKNSSQ
jgi:hypothetical protein